MLTFALRKLIILLLTLLVVSAVVFAIVGGNARALRTIAVLELGPRTPQTEQDRFIQRTIFHQCDPGTGAEVVIEAPDDPEHPNGFYIDPNKCRSLSLAQRYGTWLFGFLQGDWGESIVFKKLSASGNVYVFKHARPFYAFSKNSCCLFGQFRCLRFDND